MCDTLGVISSQGALFAKNSDRSPNEVQVSEFYPAQEYSQESQIKLAYAEIPQVTNTYAIVISRPVWLWGAEMGVNEYGVCIGNEAVFTKGQYSKKGLMGMDLLRLGLERAETAAKARDIIIELLERYGQGGNCGFDHAFYYDNSFLIMDKQELFVLETAGKEWVYKQYNKRSISNRLMIGSEGDSYSKGLPVNFKGKHIDPIYSFFSGSKKRLEQTSFCLENLDSVESLIRVLRSHSPKVKNPLAQSSVSSPCMHAGGIVGDHTTASWVVDLSDPITLWISGSSTPCISLFKPWRFGCPLGKIVFELDDEKGKAYWLKRENFHRAQIGKSLPDNFYLERDALQSAWINQSQKTDLMQLCALSDAAVFEEELFFESWKGQEDTHASKRFLSYWKKKNAALEKCNGI